MSVFNRKIVKSESGLSFLEIMIALTITTVVVVAVYRLYLTQHRNYLIQDDVTEIQQNVRASIDELGRNVRMAGFALPEGLEPIVAFNTDPDTIIINFFNQDCETFLSAPMPQPSAELKCGSDVSCFSEGQWVYIYDPNDKYGEWFEITHVQQAAMHLQHNTMSLSRAYDEDAMILAVTQLKYYIDNVTDPENPKFMIKRVGQEPQIFADNISDMQFTYRMKNGTVLDQPVLASNIIEILISLTGNSYWKDLESTQDTVRSRTFSTSINPRNM